MFGLRISIKWKRIKRYYAMRAIFYCRNISINACEEEKNN